MAILLNIRLIQVKRELNSTGLGALVALGLLSFLIYAAYTVFLKSPDAYYLSAFLFLVCVSVQSYRNDKQFVYVHIRKPHSEMYSEYLLITFPFTVSSLFTHNWFCFPILAVALYLVPFLKFTLKQKTYLKHISSFIPASDFEWISGLRRSFGFLVPLYLVALGLSWFRVFPLIILWFISVTVASFYTECEPLHILREGNFSAVKLLKRKLLRMVKYILILQIPVLVINTIFNPEFWLLNLLFIPLQISFVSYAVFLKYSSYEPNKNAIGNNVILSVVSLGSIIPYFLPIPLLMAIFTYGKAKTNLNNYLND
ncbi:MAG: hypothetical protein Q7U54_14765 [Bacteroidales bacterium]|nr:hypothetical protein [Bacteroidales bacterium]